MKDRGKEWTDLESRNAAVKYYTEWSAAIGLLREALEFMNMVPNNKYGDNYAICSRISEFLKEKEEK